MFAEGSSATKVEDDVSEWEWSQCLRSHEGVDDYIIPNESQWESQGEPFVVHPVPQLASDVAALKQILASDTPLQVIL